MKKYTYLTLMLFISFALAHSSQAQSNNYIAIFQGGVNTSTFEATNSQALVDQTAESGTVNSSVSIQQVGDLQFADIDQTNVGNSHVNTFQNGNQNTINIDQIDGDGLVLFARQFTGTENTVAVGQTGSNNGAAVVQVGSGNSILVGQSGENNRTVTASALNEMHLKFLSQSPYDVSAYNPGGSGWTDGILQRGDDNLASLAQSGDNNGAFIYQEGDRNNASIQQAGSHDLSYVLQRGADNIARTNQ